MVRLLGNALRSLAGLGCMFILAGVAYAGPSNRGPIPSQLNGPSVGLGSPLPAVEGNSSDLQIFITGQTNFQEVDTIPQLGPVFNGHTSCAGCHFQGALGGGASINEIRVRDNQQPGPVHMFAVDNAGFNEPTSAGCSVTDPECMMSQCQLQEVGITGYSTNLTVCDPSSAQFIGGTNCLTGRQTLPLFGDGLVEAVDDQLLVWLSQIEPEATRGTAKFVTEVGSSQSRVGRFGWKDDHATLRGFAGDAYLNEMGITNPDHTSEVSECALSDPGLETPLADEPEDTTDPDGRADIDRFADFMRALNPPPSTTSSSNSRGALLFAKIGCADCHTPVLVTSSNPAAFIPATTGGVPMSASLNQALSSMIFFPFSDFLLHDMGSLGDGITSGTAGPTMMRTAPLWGIGVRTTFLHDGRASNLSSAITSHDGQGKSAAQAFEQLSPDDQQSLLNFVNSL
jgi:Di-haem oxidoreductase, putative peroxidase